MLLKDQGDVCGVTPMPTDRVDDTSRVATATSETVTWLYLSSGAYASATAQAAGTIVTGKLDYDGVTNSMGSNLGTHLDTSLSWGAATRLDSLATVPDDVLSKMAFMSPTDQIATITPYLTTNGEYIIDHRRGQIWAMPKATVADDAATYTYKVPLSTGSGSTVDITMVGGQSVATDDAAMVASPKFLPIGGEYRASATTYSDGDATILQTDVNGKLLCSLSSDIEIGAVELKDGTTDARQAVKVDNATAGATPTVALTGGIYKDALDTYADNDATPNHHDVNGQLLTTVNGLAGSVAHDAADAGNPVKIGGYAASSQRTAAAAADRVDAIFTLNGQLVTAPYTWATNSDRTEEIDPLSQHYVNETLLDLTNIATNTTGYGYVDMNGFSGLSIQGETSGATPTDVLTVTIEGTNQDDGTAPASCTYQDITAMAYDYATQALGTASWADTDFYAYLSPQVAGLFKYVRVKYVTSNASGNDCDLTVYTKKAYI